VRRRIIFSASQRVLIVNSALPFSDALSVDEQKATLRSEAKSRRKVAVGAAGKDANDLFTKNILALAKDIGLDGASVIAGYLAMADELDVVPAMLRLGEACGARCAMPVVVGKNTPLVFRQWDQNTEMESGGFGTRHPVPGTPVLSPTIVLVPLLAFDAFGSLLGWGGGFYDRTLQMLRNAETSNVVAVGCAYAGQEMDAVVRDEYDQPVDWIVTEREIRRVRPS